MLSVSFSKEQNVKEFQKGQSKRYLNKPLYKQKFYLDVKNRAVASRLEAKIKELGGDVELFLVQDIKSFITDREEICTGINKFLAPRTPQPVSNQFSFFDSPTRNENDKVRPKTRADAMLEKARIQSSASAKDPLEEAKQWQISILSVEKALAWLDKISVSVKLSLEKKKSKVKELKAPFLKFEVFDRKTRPVFQEIPNWPIFNLNGAVGEPAFICRSPGEHNMTRKTRANNIKAINLLQPGYCEACRIEYTYLEEHLKSDKHQSFVNDSNNFEELDDLINEGCNINCFLKVNGALAKPRERSKSTTPLKSNSYKSNISKKMPKTRTSSICDKLKSAPMSPGSDSGHNLRTRRQNSLYSSLNSNCEEETVVSKPTRELRSRTKASVVTLNANSSENSETWSSGRPKRSCIKQKRISADERLVFDNKTYYKVEVLTNKLRSSSIPLKGPEVPKVQTNSEDGQEDKGLIVKFRRMRYSELARLNDEAENFLFPRKDESSSEDDIDEDGPNTTVSTKKDETSLLLSSEDDTKSSKIKNEEDHSMDSSCSEQSGGRKKRRRTQAEAFIADNQKYYKFEMPGSRLRYQGTYLAPLPPKTNGECISKESEKSEVKDETKESKIDLSQVKLSFEIVPKSEPWYETFQRQDNGEEYYYSSFSDSGFWKPFILPYELGPLPPVDPRICYWAYKQRQKLKESTISNSEGCSTSSACNVASECDSKSDPNCNKSIESTKSDQEVVSQQGTEIKSNNLKKPGRRRKGILLPSRNPRKSPRQHASTLAILSSLIQQRKRRDGNKSRSPDASLAVPSLPRIPEEKKPVKTLNEIELEQDYDSIAKNIDDVLSTAVDSNSEIENIHLDEKEDLEDVNLKFEMRAVDMLEDYMNVKQNSALLKPTQSEDWPVRGTPGRKPSRKKKKNRTGWPNKKREKHLMKKEDKEDNDLSEQDSIVNSPGVHADSEEEDDCKTEDKKLDNPSESLSTAEDGNRLVNDHETLSVNNNEHSGNKQGIVVNGTTSNEKNDLGKQKRLDAKCREQRKSSSDNCAELVIASAPGDKMDCVNVDLEKWESAEKVLTARLSNSESICIDKQLQPIVRVEKLDSEDVALKRERQRSLSPRRTNKRPRRMPASPKSPRILRKPRGRWYRERF